MIEDAETVDQKTGEIIPAPSEAAMVPVGDMESPTEDAYKGIATQPVSEEEAAFLMEPVDITDLDILPTGEIYLSQVGYRRRLAKVFGPGGWGMKPLSGPAMQGNDLMQEWALYARGNFIASAYGKAEYQPTNARMSYADALEALKSNALMRCCKDLAIATECWDKRFCQKFQAEQCVKVWRTKAKQGKGEYQWRRKDAQPFYDERGIPDPGMPRDSVEPPPDLPSPQEGLVTKVAFITRGTKKSGETWEKWAIGIAGVDYTTFSTTVVEIAEEAMKKGIPVRIVEATESKFGPNLNKIELDIQTKEPPNGSG